MGVMTSAIQENLRKIDAKTSVSILPCRITKVHKENLTADVYIQETSGIVYNVPICFPSKGKGYGAYFMPKENSTYLLVYSSKSKPYILAHAPVSISSDGSNTNSEKLMPGENVTQSIGNAFTRQDLIGNTISASQFGNSAIQDANGVNRSSSLGVQVNTIAHKNIVGFALMQNACTDREALNSGTMKVFDYSEHYSKIEFSKVYKPDEIITYVGGDISINLTAREAVIADSKAIIDKVALFKTALLTKKSSIQTLSKTDAELAAEIAATYTELKTFNIARKGVKIISEKGNALNNRPNNISDVTKLTELDFSKRDGIDIIYRFRAEDSETSDIKANIQIDANGNCDMKFKSLNIDAETFTTIVPPSLGAIDGGDWDEI